MPGTRIKLSDDFMNLIVLSVSERTGHMIGKEQFDRIESRLTKRAMTLGLLDEPSYINYFNENQEQELDHLITFFTTHYSFFFKDYDQFEYLKDNLLPNIVKQIRASGRRKIRIWSANGSHGQEAYSLYMFIDQYLKNNSLDIEIDIIGTDIDKVSVKFASSGVYTWQEVQEIPLVYLSRYWSRGTEEISRFAKLKEEVKKHCFFTTLNLLETKSFKALGKFDIIFCRNVLNNFIKSEIEAISDAFADALNPEGCFVVGITESFSRSPKGMYKKGPSIFVSVNTLTPEKMIEKPKIPIRVFCVDDAPSTLKILNVILSSSNDLERL